MKHVLVVEDDPHNAVVFRKLLERRGGLRVTLTDSAADLLRFAVEGGIDLIIMDVSLPNARWRGRAVSGVDLCRLLREDARSARTMTTAVAECLLSRLTSLQTCTRARAIRPECRKA